MSYLTLRAGVAPRIGRFAGHGVMTEYACFPEPGVPDADGASGPTYRFPW
jgi:hypothetical protein